METQITLSGNTVYWKTFKWGTIIPSESTFQLVPRSRKNIFKMFNGLGLNEELLFLLKELNIKYIEVPFCGDVLETTTEKWLTKGIPSPYCSVRVDQQLILPLDKINLDEADTCKVSSTQEQLSLFGGV
jgi:hypothetical protein